MNTLKILTGFLLCLVLCACTKNLSFEELKAMSFSEQKAYCSEKVAGKTVMEVLKMDGFEYLSLKDYTLEQLKKIKPSICGIFAHKQLKKEAGQYDFDNYVIKDLSLVTKNDGINKDIEHVENTIKKNVKKLEAKQAGGHIASKK